MRSFESYYRRYYAAYPWGHAFATWVSLNPLRAWRRGVRDNPAYPDFADLSEIEVAKRLGIDRGNMWKMEHGKFMPTDRRLAQLTEITGIPDLASAWNRWLRSFPREIPLDDPEIQKRLGVVVIQMQRVLRAAA